MKIGETWNDGHHEIVYLGICNEEGTLKGKAMYYEYRIEEKEKFYKNKCKTIWFDTLDDLKDKKIRDEKQRIFIEELKKKEEIREKIEAKEKAKRENVHGFCKNMSPMKRGRIIKTLNKQFRFNGIIKTRKENIEQKVTEGWKIVEHRCFGRIFKENIEGAYSFYDSKCATKTELDYASYLISIDFKKDN